MTETKPELSKAGKVIWLYGLSGAGKTTIAYLLKEKLAQTGHTAVVLDGDVIRNGLNKDLTFSMEDRSENIRRVAEFAKLLKEDGIVVICALITPLATQRLLARSIIGYHFIEVFVDCPWVECHKRDVKGLYKLAQQNKLKNFTGNDSAFEPSYQSDLVIPTSEVTPQQACASVYNYVFAPLNMGHLT